MKSIVKSVTVVGQVIGLLIGAKFTTPTAQVLEHNPNIGTF
jgi:hypothetical protein